MKEQIEEMAFDLCLIDRCKHLPQEECNNTTCAHCEAEALYNAGYRKQSDGEWIEHHEDGTMNQSLQCSVCNWKTVFVVMGKKDYKFCPNCGAKMKG